MSGFSCGFYVYKMKKRTPQLSLRCSSGGDKRDRTADLLNAIQALSQLSYTPVSKSIIANYGVNVKMFFRVSAKKYISRHMRHRCGHAPSMRGQCFAGAGCSVPVSRLFHSHFAESMIYRQSVAAVPAPDMYRSCSVSRLRMPFGCVRRAAILLM